MQYLSYLFGVASLVCFIVVIVKMFQNQQTGLGIVCLILALCGIGVLIAFIVGWMNAEKWQIKNVMLIWTAIVVINIIIVIIAPPKLPQAAIIFAPQMMPWV